ncbi:MAG TPA: biotin-dependent carboxyltransferase family protein, partial [Polyangiaceae bacterium]|nr:biotin-dependent carboxyltransferase family protein [Polyangiaceae bacterium]
HLQITGARTTAVVETPDELPGAAAVPAATPWAVRTGQVLSIGQPEHGLRAYLALRGGIDVPLVLGSRSTDVLGRLGPARLESGSVLAVGRATEAVGMPEPEPGPPSSGRAATQVRVVLGPRDDEFGAAGTTRLVGQEWTVSATSNRVGLRLEGAPVVRLVAGEVPSEPMVPGAIQVPPAGLPVVLFRDHPVTGGYPVIGVVVPEDLDLLAQLAPGDHLRLSVVAPPD